MTRKKRSYETEDSWILCLRYLLIMINLLYFALACTVLGISIHFAVNEVNFIAAVLGNDLLVIAVYLVLVSSCIVFLITILGSAGALLQNRCLLGVYSFLLAAALLLSLTGAILAIVFRTTLSEALIQYMKDTLQKDYGISPENEYNSIVTSSWDAAQEQWYCCSVEDESWGVYRQSEWYTLQYGISEATRPYVPASCCRQDQYGNYINLNMCQLWRNGPPGKQSGELNPALHYRGCYTAAREILYDISGYLIGMGIAFAFCMITGLILSIFMIIRLKR